MKIPASAIQSFEPLGIPLLSIDGGIPLMLKTMALSLRLMKTTSMPEHFLEDIERMVLDKGAVRARCILKSMWCENGMPQGSAIKVFWSMNGRDTRRGFIKFTFPYLKTI